MYGGDYNMSRDIILRQIVSFNSISSNGSGVR